jgi:acetyl esterase
MLRLMPLDPQAQMLLDQMASMGTPPLQAMSVPEARAFIDSMGAFNSEVEDVAHVEDVSIPGPASTIPARLYRPAGTGPFPLLVYFHGGGWVIGGIQSHDGLCRSLANAAACAVLSIDYRLAPEHKFPAPVDDCYAATAWAVSNAASLGADPARVAIGGDSAGGNLTAVVAQLARDRKSPPLRFQLLIYPATDAGYDTPSYRENATGYFLELDGMRWFYDHYLRSEADRADPRASPLRATDLRELPPALVITAEFDPLRDEGEHYAARLREADVPVTLTRYDGMIHGFFGMAPLLDQGKQAVAEAATALRAALR